MAVAVRALFFDRLMNKSSLSIQGLLLFMTIQAEIPGGLGEAKRRVGTYCTMTNLTYRCRNRGMDILGLRVRVTFFRDALLPCLQWPVGDMELFGPASALIAGKGKWGYW